MSALRKSRSDRDERPPRRPESILRKRSTSIPPDNESRLQPAHKSPSHRFTSPLSRIPTSPSRVHGLSPTQGRAPSPHPPSPSLRGRGITPLRRIDNDGDSLTGDRFASQLMEIEEKFNREMEHSRRRDLEKKHALRERQMEGRIRVLEDLLRTSNDKAAALVRLMNERERQMEDHFSEQLEKARRGNRAVRMEDDRLELMQLQAQVKNLRLENDQLREDLASRDRQSARRPPFFGMEIEDMGRGEPGVLVATVTGPSASAGLKPNDVITQLTVAWPIRSRLDFHHAVGRVEAGDRVQVAVVRANGEKEMVAVVPGGSNRPALRGLENLSCAGSVADSVTRSISGCDEVSTTSSHGIRASLRRSISMDDKGPELRTYYKPMERPLAPGPEIVRHVALDGTVSYVPMTEVVHLPTTPTLGGPALANRPPYVPGVRVQESPAVRRLPLSPDKIDKSMVRVAHQPMMGEEVEEVSCE